MLQNKKSEFGLISLLTLLFGSVLIVSAAVINATHNSSIHTALNNKQIIKSNSPVNSIKPNEIIEIVEYKKIDGKVQILVLKIRNIGSGENE